MAIGALLGVKILRRNTEHVVTLDANTMKDRLPWRRSFVFRGMGLGPSRFGCHEEILAYWRARSTHAVRVLRTCGIPNQAHRILTNEIGVNQAAAGHSFAARNFVRMPCFNPAS